VEPASAGKLAQLTPSGRIDDVIEQHNVE